MMQKLKPIFVIIPGAVLPIIVICVFAFVLLPPVKKTIGDTTRQRDDRKTKADTRPKVEERLKLAEENLKKQQQKLDQFTQSRSIPVSTYEPVQAMIMLWFEFQEDLKPAIEQFIQSSGCEITNGATLPAPEMKKPTLGPSNFIRVPASGALTLKVRGTMPQLRRLYTSLSTFRRVATIGALDVTPTANGDTLDATIPLTVYILAEGPAVAAAPAGAPSGMPGMSGPGGPGMPGMPGKAGPGGKAGAKAGAKAGGKASEDDSGGGGGPKLKRGGGGGDEGA